MLEFTNRDWEKRTLSFNDCAMLIRAEGELGCRDYLSPRTGLRCTVGVLEDWHIDNNGFIAHTWKLSMGSRNLLNALVDSSFTDWQDRLPDKTRCAIVAELFDTYRPKRR